MASLSGKVLDIANMSFCENLKCSICLDILKSPKALTCLHTFCEACIQANIDAANINRRPNSIVCPECRQQTTPPNKCAPGEWAKQLPTNWPIKGFIEKLESHAAIATDTEAGDVVDGQRSINPCDLEECRQIEICPTHSGKTLQFYCMEHTAVLCEECRAGAHRWGCSVVAIDSIAIEGAVAQNETGVQAELNGIHQKLESTMDAMRKDIRTVGDNVDKFQVRLKALRNEVDLLMTEMQYELSGSEFRDMSKSKLTCSQRNTLTECESLQEAMRFSKSEKDVIENYGTPVQRFIAMERLRSLVPIFKRAADDNARSATRMEIRHEGIEILDSVVHMQKEMKNIEGVRVKLFNTESD